MACDHDRLDTRYPGLARCTALFCQDCKKELARYGDNLVAGMSGKLCLECGQSANFYLGGLQWCTQCIDSLRLETGASEPSRPESAATEPVCAHCQIPVTSELSYYRYTGLYYCPYHKEAVRRMGLDPNNLARLDREEPNQRARAEAEVCDCGALVSNTTHARWCSTRE